MEHRERNFKNMGHRFVTGSIQIQLILGQWSATSAAPVTQSAVKIGGIRTWGSSVQIWIAII